MAVVGSGIMGERLSAGNIAVALLANTIATGAALVALILTFGPVSGAHFNPAVTLADASQRGIPWREVPGYVVAPDFGCLRRRDVCPPDVRVAALLIIPARPQRHLAGLRRVHRNFRAAVGNMGLFAAALVGRAFCCRGLYHSRVLVHGIDIVR